MLTLSEDLLLRLGFHASTPRLDGPGGVSESLESLSSLLPQFIVGFEASLYKECMPAQLYHTKKSWLEFLRANQPKVNQIFKGLGHSVTKVTKEKLKNKNYKV